MKYIPDYTLFFLFIFYPIKRKRTLRTTYTVIMSTSNIIVFISAVAIATIRSQSPEMTDVFQKNLCHDRWSQMDWQSIIRPCRQYMKFGMEKRNVEKLRTSPKWSHTLGKNPLFPKEFLLEVRQENDSIRMGCLKEAGFQ